MWGGVGGGGGAQEGGAGGGGGGGRRKAGEHALCVSQPAEPVWRSVAGTATAQVSPGTCVRRLIHTPLMVVFFVLVVCCLCLQVFEAVVPEAPPERETTEQPSSADACK